MIEMPWELHGCHAGGKYDLEYSMGIQKNYITTDDFQPSETKEKDEASRRVTKLSQHSGH